MHTTLWIRKRTADKRRITRMRLKSWNFCCSVTNSPRSVHRRLVCALLLTSVRPWKRFNSLPTLYLHYTYIAPTLYLHYPYIIHYTQYLTYKELNETRYISYISSTASLRFVRGTSPWLASLTINGYQAGRRTQTAGGGRVAAFCELGYRYFVTVTTCNRSHK